MAERQHFFQFMQFL